MDNLPKDPPDQDNNQSAENEIHSEVAKHEQRDAHGRFIPEHEQTPLPNSPNLPTTPNLPNPPQPQVLHTSTGGGGGNDKPSDDDPLFEAKVNNPFSKFFNWIKKLIKSEGINIKVKPLTAIGIALALSVGFGSGYGVGYNAALYKISQTLFPNSSPIFHRPISLQGVIQKSESGQYYLSVPDNPLWLLKPVTNINLDNVLNKQVTVKGNLTAEPNVINVTEVIAFDKPTPVMYVPTQQPATNSAQPY